MAGIDRIIAVTAGLATLGMVGCGPQFDYDGEWIGHRDHILENASEELQRSFNLVKLKIEGRRFELVDEGIPFEGTVRRFARPPRAELIVERRLNRPLADSGAQVTEVFRRPIVLEPTEAGSLLYRAPSDSDSVSVALRRLQPNP